MKFYLSSQALDNKGNDDCFEYSDRELIKIDERKQVKVSNLLYSIMDKGRHLHIKESIRVFYLDNSTLNIALLIKNEQKDINGRSTETALIIEEFEHRSDYNSIPIEDMLTQFLTTTNRMFTESRLKDLASDSVVSLKEVKKKRKSHTKTLWLVFIILLIICVIGFLIN